MTWLTESFWPIVALGVVVEVVLAIALVRTGRAMWLVAMGTVLALVVAGVAVEWLVVTEREDQAMRAATQLKATWKPAPRNPALADSTKLSEWLKQAPQVRGTGEGDYGSRSGTGSQGDVDGALSRAAGEGAGPTAR